MSDKSFLKMIAFLAGCIVFLLVARIIIFGGKPLVKLSAAPTLAGSVSIGIAPTGSNTPLQQEGKNFTIKKARYFDNGEWVVVNINPVKNNADPAVMVLKKINGVYQTVLGPNNQFTNSYLYVMPVDVGGYLYQIGAINEQ